MTEWLAGRGRRRRRRIPQVEKSKGASKWNGIVPSHDAHMRWLAVAGAGLVFL